MPANDAAMILQMAIKVSSPNSHFHGKVHGRTVRMRALSRAVEGQSESMKKVARKVVVCHIRIVLWPYMVNRCVSFWCVLFELVLFVYFCVVSWYVV